MNPYCNLPPEQHRLQRLVDRFNGERRWEERMAPRRRVRRALRPQLTEEQHRELDRRDEANLGRFQEFVGELFPAR
jgi:hypothetical protein